mmetsp:Transcript_7171/g.10767  ORF Transcript_7171/g.10767 Transcript_7171/m.10767 type:complete len:171 (-) Transcript_7171:234-746(-)
MCFLGRASCCQSFLQTWVFAMDSKFDGDEEFAGSKEERSRDGLLEAAVKFLESGHYKNSVDDFVESNSHIFAEAAEAKNPEEEEHKLEYSDLHTQYLELVEGLLKDFIEDQHCTIEEFYASCKDALEDKYCAIFEEHEYHWFVDSLLASMEYSKFFDLMLKSAQNSSNRK